jgi:hypothetical protein
MIQPQKVSELLMVFPGDVRHLMPEYDAIPAEFKDQNRPTPWNRFANQWFCNGLTDPKFYPVEGIDAETAFRQIQCILSSYQPKHEHKEATVAYLASLWFTKIEYVSHGEEVTCQSI